MNGEACDHRRLIRVCEWLDADTYRTLVKYFDYVGREYGCSLFQVNERKLAHRLGSVDELVEIVKSKAEDFMDALEAIECALRKVKVVELGLDERGRGFVVRSPVMLSNYLAGIEGVKYDPSLKGFVVKPYSVVQVVEVLRSHGFRVSDLTGMLECRELKGYELKVSLRPYQEEAIKAWEAKKTGVIVLPTGSGKTIVALAAIVRSGCPTLIVVYTREQMVQWFEKVRQATTIPQSLVGMFYGERKEIKPVTIATYQSAVRHIDKLRGVFKLLVVDEAHHLPAKKFKTIALAVLAPYRMALSATPYREDGLHEELFKLMGGVVYQRSFSELAEQGYVASYEVVVVRVRLTPQERAVYRKLVDELKRYPKINEALLSASIDYSELARAYKLVAELRRLLTSMESKVKALKRIVEDEMARGSKIIVFVDYVDLAERIARELKAILLTGKLNERLRDLALRKFRASSTAVLVTTTVADEGLDVVDANVGVLLSALISRRQFKQRLGRLLRPAEGKVARLYVLVGKGTFEERRLAAKLLEDESTSTSMLVV